MVEDRINVNEQVEGIRKVHRQNSVQLRRRIRPIDNLVPEEVNIQDVISGAGSLEPGNISRRPWDGISEQLGFGEFASAVDRSKVIMIDSNFKKKFNGEELESTPNGLVDAVFLMGSTHDKALWRKKKNLLETLKKENNLHRTIDPQAEVWDSVNGPDNEALAMSESSVIAFRLENSGLKEGSLGSMAEVFAAARSALSRGQRIVVSIEDGFKNSMDSAGSKNQYAMFEFLLQELETQLPEGMIKIHRGNDLEGFAQQINEALHMQRDETKMLQPLEINNLEENLPENPKVVISGSGKPQAEMLQYLYLADRKELVKTILATTNPGEVVNLTEGEWEEKWNSIYNKASLKPEDFIDLISAEFEKKMSADLIVLLIHDNQSNSAAMEALFWECLALAKRKKVATLMESFDADTFSRESSGLVPPTEIKNTTRLRKLIIAHRKRFSEDPNIFYSDSIDSFKKDFPGYFGQPEKVLDI